MKRMLMLSVIAMLCYYSSNAQNCFSFAGEDTRTCNFQDTLIGTPAGGEWSFNCTNSGDLITMESLNDSAVIINFLKCGTYMFEYTIDNDSCFANDTIVVDFENPSSAFFDVEMEVELEYVSIDCANNQATSCDDNLQVEGEAPIPIWTFSPYGNCNSTIYEGTAMGMPDSCIVDSIVVTISNFSGTLDTNTNLTFLPNEVAVVDDNEMVVVNNFFNLMDQTQGVGVQELSNDCPIPTFCHSLPPECLDTLYDTLTVIVPVHLGGYWTVFENGTFINLDSNYSFMIDTFNYFLNVEPSIDSYNASFTLNEIDYLGDTIGVTNTVDLTLKWEEKWTADTISRIYTIFSVRDSCCGGGVEINRPNPILPVTPEYDCPAFTLTFIPEMKTSDPIVTCGDSTYTVSVEISDGIPPYDFAGITGSINGNIFTSDPLHLDSVNFAFDIFDNGECEERIQGDNCSCLMNANASTFDLTVSTDCGAEGNGELLIEHLSGGYAPFVYSIDQGAFQDDTIFQNLDFGNYSLTVRDSFACLTNLDFFVEPAEWEILDDIYLQEILCGIENIEVVLPLIDTNIVDYQIEWEDGDTSLTKNINEGGTYQATISLFSTCQKYQVFFEIEDPYFFNENDIKIPNAFTPNGDGLNDDFSALLDPQIEVVDFSLAVFNRWGNRVYFSNNHEELWQPIRQNASDVFLWILDMSVKNCNGEIIFVKRSGDLTLIR